MPTELKPSVLFYTEYEIVELYIQKRFDDFEDLKDGTLVIDEVGKFEIEDWKMKHLESFLVIDMTMKPKQFSSQTSMYLNLKNTMEIVLQTDSR